MAITTVLSLVSTHALTLALAPAGTISATTVSGTLAIATVLSLVSTHALALSSAGTVGAATISGTLAIATVLSLVSTHALALASAGTIGAAAISGTLTLAVTILIPVLVLHLRTSLADSLSLHGSRLRLWLTDSLRRDRICSQNHLATARNGSQDDKRYWSKGFHGSLLGKCIDPCSYAHIGLDAGHCENTIDGKAAA